MKQLLIFYILALLFISCGDDDENKPLKFSQEDFLTSYAEIIYQDFNRLNENSVHFEATLNHFKDEKTPQKLEQLQQAWENLYSSYMKTNAYNFGVAGAQGAQRTLVTEINSFPVNTHSVMEKIETDDFKLNDEKRDTRGLNTIEYLIFSPLESFTDNKMNYLSAVTEDMNNKISSIQKSWSSTYKNEFISNTGTAVKSSTTQFFNSWAQSLVSLQTLKLGSPMGKYDSTNQVFPIYVENYYSQTSLKHLKEHFKSLERIWQGQNNLGWKQYVDSTPNGRAISTKIEHHFETIHKRLNSITNDKILSDLIEEDSIVIEEIYLELRELQIIIYTEMSSALGVAVTSTDQDGD